MARIEAARKVFTKTPTFGNTNAVNNPTTYEKIKNSGAVFIPLSAWRQSKHKDLKVWGEHGNYSTSSYVNGSMEHRVANNLNISFNYVEGESLMMALRDVAVSSGSACTSASLEPSYVLRALGRNDELAHSSIRFTLGRWTTEEEIDYTINLTRNAVAKLRELSPLWDMFKEGIDLNTIEWSAH